jgi:hypothetical protein
MKKDGVSNPLRRKCLRLKLKIRSLNAGARTLLGTGRNHGSGAENESEHASRQFLHERGSSLLSTVRTIKKRQARENKTLKHGGKEGAEEFTADFRGPEELPEMPKMPKIAGSEKQKL